MDDHPDEFVNVDLEDKTEPEVVKSTKKFSRFFRCCLSDRSYTCFFLAIVISGIITGGSIGFFITQNKIMSYLRPPAYVPPEKYFSIDYLWPGHQYEFYKEKETAANAQKICQIYNTTLLTFSSVEEEIEFDCYMNVRNNAEDQQVILWLNETILFGGPLMYARLQSYYSENRQDVIRYTKKVLDENGCDIQQNFADRVAGWSIDQENRKAETVYNIAKVYGNYGIRSKKQGSRNGCWNMIRWNVSDTLKLNFACKRLIPVTTALDTSSLLSSALSPFYQKRLFSHVHC